MPTDNVAGKVLNADSLSGDLPFIEQSVIFEYSILKLIDTTSIVKKYLVPDIAS